uniref:Protoporphyrinogen IX oxidase n=1 Tax=Arundo donax TaxID=35708 RepID=A0A0A9D0C7_ARUDO
MFFWGKPKHSVLFQSLIDALHNEVGDGNVKLGTEVLSLACSFDEVPASGGWSISVDSKDGSSKELAKNQAFDAVIMTVIITDLYLSFRSSVHLISYLANWLLLICRVWVSCTNSGFMNIKCSHEPQ